MLLLGIDAIAQDGSGPLEPGAPASTKTESLCSGFSETRADPQTLEGLARVVEGQSIKGALDSHEDMKAEKLFEDVLDEIHKYHENILGLLAVINVYMHSELGDKDGRQRVGQILENIGELLVEIGVFMHSKLGDKDERQRLGQILERCRESSEEISKWLEDLNKTKCERELLNSGISVPTGDKTQADSQALEGGARVVEEHHIEGAPDSDEDMEAEELTIAESCECRERINRLSASVENLMRFDRWEASEIESSFTNVELGALSTPDFLKKRRDIIERYVVQIRYAIDALKECLLGIESDGGYIELLGEIGDDLRKLSQIVWQNICK